jgi:hypothetical protein
MLTQFVVSGKEHLIPQFMMADCVTGQQQEQHNEQLYDYALQRLALTSEQQQRIQAMLMCFQGLLTAVVEERQALQTQLFPQGMAGLGPPDNGRCSSAGGPAAAAAAGMAGAANDDGTINTTSSSKAAGTGGTSAPAGQDTTEDGSLSGSGSSSSSSGGDERSTNTRASDGHGSTKVALSQQQHARREQQQQHQQQLAHMFKLLKKESLLKCCCWVGIEGCMTYVQLAKLAVLCFPYPASPIAFATALDKILKQQQQQHVPQAESGQQQQQLAPSSM